MLLLFDITIGCDEARVSLGFDCWVLYSLFSSSSFCFPYYTYIYCGDGDENRAELITVGFTFALRSFLVRSERQPSGRFTYLAALLSLILREEEKMTERLFRSWVSAMYIYPMSRALYNVNQSWDNGDISVGTLQRILF